jgi:hypothetical protein
MRYDRTRFALAAVAAVLSLAACTESLALKDNLEAKVEYAAATYTLTLVSGNSSGGTVNLDAQKVHNEERLQIAATPKSGWLFSNWTVSPAGSATVADPNSESTTAYVVGTDATIQANFTAPKTRTWSAIASSSSGQRLYATENQGKIYASSNYGSTWSLLGGSPLSTWVSIACDVTGRYLVAAGNQSGAICTSSDYGASWTARAAGLPASNSNWDWSDVASDGTGRYLVAANNYGTVYTSADFGATWTERGTGNGLPSMSEPWSSVASDSSGSILSAAISGGNVYYSTNGGALWSAMTGLAAHSDNIYLSENDDGSRFQVALANSNIMATDTHTLGWYTSSNTPGWVAIDSDGTGEHIIAATYQGAIWTSNNFGGAYTSHSGASVGLPGSGTTEASWSGVCSDGTGTRLAACASNSHIYVSSNQGADWSLGL